MVTSKEELPSIYVTALALTLALHADAAARSRVRSVALVTLFLLCSLGPQLSRRWSGVDEYWNVNHLSVDREQQFLIDTVRRYTTPGESLAVWGWRSSLYVETGLRQAARQGQTEQQIRTNPWQPCFLRRFYDDLVAARPPVFVDAVGPRNFAFHDRAKAHEAFPPLRTWVSEHYTLVVDTGGTRVYVADERLAARGANGTAATPARAPAPPGS